MNYVIGIIDVIKNYTFWKSYNNFMKGDTFRKKFNEWFSLRGSELRFSVTRSHRDGSEIITNNVCYDQRSKLGVFEYLHKKSLEKYLKTTKVTLSLKGRLNWELCSQVLLKN